MWRLAQRSAIRCSSSSGLATVAVGSLSLLAQTHFKRLLAFSSIEHMGLACFGLALGPLGVFAALLHLTGHALAKSADVPSRGPRARALRFRDNRPRAGPARDAPHKPALLFAAGIFALGGLPPVRPVRLRNPDRQGRAGPAGIRC